MFLFLFKSKYRQKCPVGAVRWLFCCFFVGLGFVLPTVDSKCDSNISCSENGVCKHNTCVCYDGWQGPQCQFGGRKVRNRRNEESSQCSFYSNCSQCRNDPACGWCDDGSNTGLGKCMPGSYTGPTLQTMSLNSSTCPSERWHFTTCPLCQCNGHASCRSNTSTCNACGDLTMGSHCKRCKPGFWGNPVNGGKCQPCECNGQFTQCHPKSGKCFCTTKGHFGNHCEKCDSTNHYFRDPINKDSCYYELTTDYRFTFNMSKKSDRQYTQIYFKNSPIKPDIDADFQITCSVMAKVNITMRRFNSTEEKVILTNHNCTTFKARFTTSEYNFGIDDHNVMLTTFYVYVYDFQTPLWIQISFSQPPKLNLRHFYITLSTLFLRPVVTPLAALFL